MDTPSIDPMVSLINRWRTASRSSSGAAASWDWFRASKSPRRSLRCGGGRVPDAAGRRVSSGRSFFRRARRALDAACLV